MKLSKKETLKVKLISEEPALVKARTALICFAAADKSYALFRVQMRNRLFDLTASHILSKPIKYDIKTYFEHWLKEPAGGIGDLVREYFSVLESLTNRPIL